MYSAVKNIFISLKLFVYKYTIHLTLELITNSKTSLPTTDAMTFKSLPSRLKKVR